MAEQANYEWASQNTTIEHASHNVSYLVVGNVCQASAAELAMQSDTAALQRCGAVLQHLVGRRCIPEPLAARTAVCEARVNRWLWGQAAPQHSVCVRALEGKGAHTGDRLCHGLSRQKL